ncbi:MAG: apolipoprotein N-acyltransferase [Kiritimatiellae bacterium]|nr:apolipoprotein N-acyltransferase [Kiritimatiellia bacterium]
MNNELSNNRRSKFDIRNSTFGIFPGILASVLSGLLLFAAFPPLEWSVLAWVALVPLLVISAAATPRIAFRWGLLAGLVFWLSSLVWLTRVSWAGWFMLCLYCALFMGCFALSVAWWVACKGLQPRQGNPLMMLSIPALWVGWEYLRSTLLSGFPWNPLGASQYANLSLIQTAQIGGVYLVSYLVVLVNAAGALILIQSIRRQPDKHRRMHPELLIALFGIGLALLYGYSALRRLPETRQTLKVTAVQVNIPQLEKWSEAWTTEINNRLRRTSLHAVEHCSPDLIVWPETVVPDFVRISRVSQKVVADVIQHGTPLLMGSMDFEDSGRSTKYFNSAFLYQPGEAPPQTYAKRHLVLFGEYIPLERWFPFLRVLTPVEESFTPGREAVVFRLGQRAFSVLICFEDTVAGLARDCVRAGARLLINQTNDAWFDPSWASRQHMAQCVFRCVENRVDAVRASNTGITCFIDRQGRIVSMLGRAEGPLPDPDYLTCTVSLPPADMPLTFYTRHGDILGLGCAAFTLTLLMAMVWLRRNHKSDAE